jgi:hypothetical protein
LQLCIISRYSRVATKDMYRLLRHLNLH